MTGKARRRQGRTLAARGPALAARTRKPSIDLSLWKTKRFRNHRWDFRLERGSHPWHFVRKFKKRNAVPVRELVTKLREAPPKLLFLVCLFRGWLRQSLYRSYNLCFVWVTYFCEKPEKVQTKRPLVSLCSAIIPVLCKHTV